MSLYSIILIISLLFPLSLSFDKKLQFYKQWNTLFPALFVVAFFFIASDIAFTYKGIWGFNSQYLLGVELFKLPIEEWLFFIIIPYASIFLHDSIVHYFPKFQLQKKTTQIVSIVLVLLSIIIIIFNFDRIYTATIFIGLATTLLFTILFKSKSLSSFYLTFIVIIIPFFGVNALLTGSYIHEEVVWYNAQEIIGFRITTIPIEDFVYAFVLIFLNLWVREFFISKLKK